MIIGTCSLCGGPVESPDAWLGMLPAPATCKNCGAVRPQYGPVIEMHRPASPLPTPSPLFDTGKPNVFGPATGSTGEPPPYTGRTVSTGGGRP